MKTFFVRNYPIGSVCVLYLILATLFATLILDTDEWHVIREPYEMLGGDYTKGYLKTGDYGKAAKTLATSYFFFWHYRPMFSPVINERHKKLFAEEEERFGYVKPDPVDKEKPNAAALYKSRLIVPEPDRLYSHGAGKPLLTQVLSVPQLALVSAFYSGTELIDIQFSGNYHPIFIVTRIVQILAGLATILLVYHIVLIEFDSHRAVFAAAICAFFPLSILFFPNLHQDSILTPFLLGAGYFFVKRRFVIGGILYGLALASKNTAIFLIPALIVLICWLVFDYYQQNGRDGAISVLKARSKELAVFVVVSTAVLLPFANPVSYGIEILTPIMDRPFDPRGGELAELSLAETSDSSTDSVIGSPMWFIVPFIKKLFGLNSVFVLFAALAASVCVQRRMSDMSKLALIMLLTVFPYGIIFGHGFGYRQLLFVPYFAVLCAAVMTKKHLAILASVLFCIALLFSIDPMSTGGLRTPVDSRTFLEYIVN